MAVDIYWVETHLYGRLGVMARPRGGDWLADEMASLRDQGVDVLVSLLERREVAELQLDAELETAEAAGLQFISFPIPDRGLPTDAAAALQLIDRLKAQLSEGLGIVVHCRQGIGRSALIAASILVGQSHSAGAAFESIRAARGVDVPDTDEQRMWVRQLR